ncbi:MAG: DUF2520 domain-containing protein [Rikenellaceae bacterium]
MKRVVVVGGGNLAESLALALTGSAEVELVQIYLRRKERGEALSALSGAPCASFEEPLAAADIYILAVSDPAIGHLSRTLPFAKGAVVAHTAGSTPIEAIDCSLRRAVFYPMQTFSSGRRVDFAQIPIFIEADDADTLEQVRKLANAVSGSVIELSSEERKRLHLSAVFVCNFVNAMFSAGESLVAASGLPFEILKPLIEESCSKALATPSPRDVQTGPAVRGDRATMDRHQAMLNENENLKEIYKNISKYIWETSKRI